MVRKIYFSIPDSKEVRPFNRILLSLLKRRKEYFRDYFEIESAYGCPSNCAWNGGRCFAGTNDSNYKEFRSLVNFYSSNEIKYRLVLTRPDGNVNDLLTNYLIRAISEYKGSVTLVSDKLEEHIQELAPRVQIHKSVNSKVYKNIDEVNRDSENRHLVLPVEYNTQITKLEHKEHIEMIPNQILCVDYHCPYYEEHLNTLEEKLQKSEKFSFIKCPLSDISTKLWDMNTDISILYQNHSHILTYEDIVSFGNFNMRYQKLVDRQDPYLSMISYIYYFVKRKYQQNVLDIYLDCIPELENIREPLERMLNYFNTINKPEKGLPDD